jgi:hypothetical protein
MGGHAAPPFWGRTSASRTPGMHTMLPAVSRSCPLSSVSSPPGKLDTYCRSSCATRCRRSSISASRPQQASRFCAGFRPVGARGFGFGVRPTGLRAMPSKPETAIDRCQRLRPDALNAGNIVPPERSNLSTKSGILVRIPSVCCVTLNVCRGGESHAGPAR